MRQMCACLLVVLLLEGCVANDGLGTATSAEVNISRLACLSVGMNQTEVLQIMHQPYSQQTFEMDGSVFNVWFYVTQATLLGQTRMVPKNLTPLTFKDGELVGWGFSEYNYLLRRQKTAEREEALAPTEADSQEDLDLEQSLKRLTLPTAASKNQGTSTTPPPKPSPGQPAPAHTPNQASEPKSPQQPNWGPIDQQQPSSAPASPGAKKKGQTSFLSMSAKPSKSSQAAPKNGAEGEEGAPQSPKQKEKKPLLSDEDRRMLEEQSEQNFNQD